MSGPSGGDATDGELLHAHAEGDPAAFGELVRRHRDRLWAVALRTLGEPEEAADALQDALLSAFRAARSPGSAYRGDAAVTTWLHRIVVNACLDRLRRRRARPTVPLPDDERGMPAARDVIGERDTVLAVTAALATLPADQRAALVLVDLQGFSVEAAAAVLEVPVGTVKSRCSRGRARLLPLLAPLREQGAGNHPGPGAVPPVDEPSRVAPLAPSPSTRKEASP